MYIKRVHFKLFFENQGGLAGLVEYRGRGGLERFHCTYYSCAHECTHAHTYVLCIKTIKES